MATYKVSVMTLYESDDTSPGESFKMSDFYHKRLLNLTLRSCECLTEAL